MRKGKDPFFGDLFHPWFIEGFMRMGGAPFGDLFTLMVWKSMRTGGAPFGDLFKGILYHIGFYTCVSVI